MKRLILIVAVILSSAFQGLAQSDIFADNQGSITFFSNAPLEDIEAKNNKGISLLNTRNNEIVVRVPIKQFQFRNRLMQGHFNENYMESERYPYATFKGKVNEAVDYKKAGSYDVSATGILHIHGVSKKRTLKGRLRITDTGMVLETNFNVMLVDHKISIPRLVFNKIAEEIAVTTRFNYSRQTK